MKCNFFFRRSALPCWRIWARRSIISITKFTRIPYSRYSRWPRSRLNYPIATMVEACQGHRVLSSYSCSLRAAFSRPLRRVSSMIRDTDKVTYSRREREEEPRVYECLEYQRRFRGMKKCRIEFNERRREWKMVYVGMCACVCMCVRLHVRFHTYICVCICLRACVRAYVHL